MNNRALTALTGSVLAIGALYIGGGFLMESSDRKMYGGTMKENMEYIKQKAPDRYFGLLENAYDRDIRNTQYWGEAANSIRDSLRIDSIAKSNYAKGLQMAKDTIKVVK